MSDMQKTGRLYLCATPIGNLEDITFRALNTLKEADLIAAEDTRHSIKLLNHYNIKKPMTSYHEYNKVEKAKTLVKKMLEGCNVALITDAGTPAISDPGEELVKQCYQAGLEVTSVPGPAACITALTISGLATRRFCFESFLSPDKKERKEILEELANETRTIILYEAPHRLVKTLEELGGVLGTTRMVTVCKELTKKYEKALRMTLKEAISFYNENEPKGEYVLVIEGKPKSEVEKDRQQEWESVSLEAHVKMYTEKGYNKKEAMRMAAKDRGISKRDIYQALLSEEGESE